MTIRSYQDTFGAGDIKQYSCGGYFTIASASNEVNIELFTPRGNSLGVIQNVGAGFWISDKDIAYIAVTSASAQTINVISGDSEVGVNKTTTSINGGTLDPHTLEVANGAREFFSGSTALRTLITPAANTGGVIVKIAGVGLVGTGACRLMFKASAPASYNDVNAGTLVGVTAASGHSANEQNDSPIIVAAGLGIYYQQSTTNAGQYALEYELK